MASTYRPSPSRLSDAFLRKLDAGFALLDGAKVRPFHYAPPLFRLRWKLGIEAVPPHFRSFRANWIFDSLLYGAVWGVLVWLFKWSRDQDPSITGAVLASALFGLIMGYDSACRMRRRVEKLVVPTWDSLAQ